LPKLRSAIANATFQRSQNIAIDPGRFVRQKTCFVDMGAHKIAVNMRRACRRDAPFMNNASLLPYNDYGFERDVPKVEEGD